MQRWNLQSYKGLLVAPDVAEGLRLLEARANEGKWRVRYMALPVSHGGDPYSLVPAGREVHFRFEKPGCSTQEALYAAWGCAVPLGFSPKLRYPLEEPGSEVFHFFGPWVGLLGCLLAEGRGHLAWPSVCCAAQVDVGVWAGDKVEARFVQAQLHRLGRNCGPIDGVIGTRTASAMESLSLPRSGLAQVAEYLRTAEVPFSDAKSVKGHVHLHGCDLVVAGYGGVKAWQVQHGAALEVTGPGRLVLDVR